MRALLPSLRTLAAAVALVGASAGAYVLARETPAFALHQVTVEGAPPRLARQVRRALAPMAGRSLVGLNGGEVLSRVESLPEVRSAAYDRAFPHVLVVSVRRERPAAVLRAGSRSWLVSERGRVLRALALGGARRFPRVWLPASAAVLPGDTLSEPAALRAVRAADVARRERFRAHVLTARAGEEGLVFVLAGGRELRLGDSRHLPLKLAVAGRILATLPAPSRGGPTYVDVSFPQRSVAGGTLKSKVEVEG
jgi:cell division protein FtsQ